MNDRPTALERAFQLAKSGLPKSMDDIRRQLAKEHYSTGQITGNTLKRQLLALIQKAQALAPPAVPASTKAGSRIEGAGPRADRDCKGSQDWPCIGLPGAG